MVIKLVIYALLSSGPERYVIATNLSYTQCTADRDMISAENPDWVVVCEAET